MRPRTACLIAAAITLTGCFEDPEQAARLASLEAENGTLKDENRRLDREADALLARNRALPAAERGDLLLVRDCGAYTLAMWSRHCNRGLPATWGYRDDGVRLLHAGESPEDVVGFWSAPVV